MINFKQFEREEEYIEKCLADGFITHEEAKKQRRELQRDIQGAIDEEAETAAQRSREENGQW